MKFPAFEPIYLKNEIHTLETVDLLLSKIEPDLNQPRKVFNEHTLKELATSIKEHGIIQPILVRKLNEQSEKYQIIAGERRWRAAQIAGLEKIPAIIKIYDKSHRKAVSLIENIQRENLNPIEEAQAIQSLLDECYMTHTQVADSLGKSRTTVSNLLRMLSLTAEVKEMINNGLLEMGHARALLSLTSEQQINTAKIIIEESLSVRETEKLVQRIRYPRKKLGPVILSKFETIEWSKYFSKQLSTKVDVKFKPDGRGCIVIHFSSIEEAESFKGKFEDLNKKTIVMS